MKKVKIRNKHMLIHSQYWVFFIANTSGLLVNQYVLTIKLMSLIGHSPLSMAS